MKSKYAIAIAFAGFACSHQPASSNASLASATNDAERIDDVCARSPAVKNALVAAAHRPTCSEVTEADLNAITELGVGSCDEWGTNTYQIAGSDFAGLGQLRTLRLCRLTSPAPLGDRFYLNEQTFASLPDLESLEITVKSSDTNSPIIFSGEVFRPLVHLRSLLLGEWSPASLEGLGLHDLASLRDVTVLGDAEFTFSLSAGQTFSVYGGSGKFESCDDPDMLTTAKSNLKVAIEPYADMCGAIGGTFSIGTINVSQCRLISNDPERYALSVTADLTCTK
jgi:hypothetical protein